MYKVLIASADPTILNWKTLPSKIKTITTELNTIQNGGFIVEVNGYYVKPDVKDGRITHAWFNTFSYPLYRKGYDFVIFHMSKAQQLKWGIQPTLRGASQRDEDFVGEMYLWADELTKRNSYNQFVETSLHELRHELCRGTVIKDDTHAVHDKYGTIKGRFSHIDMDGYLPVRKKIAEQLTPIQKLVDSLVARFQRPKPFIDWPYRVTQAFGVKNPIYKQTGVHIGSDFAAPSGTVVYAPLNGTLVKTIGKETGIMATLYTHKGTYQFLHLSHGAPNGTYVQGQPIGVTGNTGLTTGPHLCVRLWKGEPNIAILTKDNVTTYLSDVTKI